MINNTGLISLSSKVEAFDSLWWALHTRFFLKYKEWARKRKSTRKKRGMEENKSILYPNIPPRKEPDALTFLSASAISCMASFSLPELSMASWVCRWERWEETGRCSAMDGDLEWRREEEHVFAGADAERSLCALLLLPKRKVNFSSMPPSTGKIWKGKGNNADCFLRNRYFVFTKCVQNSTSS